MPNEVYDGITPFLEAKAAELRDPTRLMIRAGNALKDILREHFRARGGKFWPSFAPQTILGPCDSTSATVLVVPTENIPYGAILAHKISGGEIVPKPPRKMLAIPTRENPEPTKWPSKYGDGELVALWGRNGPYALCDARMLKKADKRREKIGKQIMKHTREEAKGQSKERKGELLDSARKQVKEYQGNAERKDIDRAKLFILVRKVRQNPDPDALPSKEYVESEIAARLSA